MGGVIGQQLRWASGGLDLLLRYFPSVWRSYTGKERLFTFMLLNYYVWGAFFMLAKLALFFLLLGGLTVRLEVPLIAAIGVFTVVSMIGNHWWERQFFIERGRRGFLMESAVMNNFLGGLYFLSLLKAMVAPNTSFHVTTKSGARTSGVSPMRSYPLAVAAALTLEIAALFLAWMWALRTGASQGGYNILAFPLVISAAANLAALAVLRRHERRATNDTLLHGPWIANAETALALEGFAVESQQRIS